MTKLSSMKMLQENNNGDPNSIKSLTLTHRALSDVSCLNVFKNLERLDLGFNNLTSLEGLKSCVNLKWLSLVQNMLQSLKGIEGLTKLTVLNAGKNKLTSMNEVDSLVSLRALILNDNEISSVCKLEHIKELNTLVLSRNPIRKIGASLAKNKMVTKLSLSNCQLEEIGSSLTSCTDLKELRLAHNDIKTLPVELGRNSWLQNLDLGNNSITNWSDIKVLSFLVNLKNLNLHGNPISELQTSVKKIKKLVPHLQIYNGRPIDRTATNEGDKTSASVVDDGKELVGEKSKQIDVPLGNKKSKKHHGGNNDPVDGVRDPDMEKQVIFNKLKGAELSEDRTATHRENDSGEKKAKRKSRLQEDDDGVPGKLGISSVNSDAQKMLTIQKSKPSDGSVINDGEELFALDGAYEDSSERKAKKKSRLKQNEGNASADLEIHPMAEKKQKKQKKDNGVIAETDRKSKKSKPGDGSAIDDGEAPFAELFATEATEIDANNGLKAHPEMGTADSLLAVPTRTNKKQKQQQQQQQRTPAALLDLSPVVEVGLGGPSTWD